MDFKTILKKHFSTKQTGFLLCMVFLYALFITASILGFTEKYQGNFIAPAALLAFVIICPVLSAYIELKNTPKLTENEIYYRGFKNAADSFHDIKQSELSEGDVIFLSRGDVSPCNGKILEGEADVESVGSSIIAGEEKGTVSFRSAKRTENSVSNTISQGDIVISGTVKIEVNDTQKSLFKSLFAKEKATDVTDIFFAAALVLSVCLVAVRLVSGGFPDFMMFGTEVVLDNVAVGAALCALIPILGQSDLFLRKIFFAKWGGSGIKTVDFPVENSAKTEEICAEISFIENTTAISFTSGELFTYTAVENIPERVAFSAALCVYRNSYNRFGIPVISDSIKAAVGFFGMSDYSVASRVVGAVHYRADERYSAVTVKSKGETTTEIFGDTKLTDRCEFYLDDDGKLIPIDKEYREAIAAKLSALASKGVKTRICAISKDAIEKGKLPEAGLTLIGFLGFVTTVSDDSAAAVRELYENGVAVRLISHEVNEYNNFISINCPFAEIVKTPVFYGENTLLAISTPDFSDILSGSANSDIAAVCVSSENASMRSKIRADFYAESMSDIAKQMNSGRMFAFNRSICAVLSAVAYLMVWAILMFVLSVLPVPFADGIMPIILVTAFILGFIKTKIIIMKAY
jgi:hypothetical protein